MEYRYGSHTVFQIEYHFVWGTKYRYKVLKGNSRHVLRWSCHDFQPIDSRLSNGIYVRVEGSGENARVVP